MKKPPIPKKIKKTLTAHNDKRIDWYYWLRDDERKDLNILNYLKKENEYTEYWFKKNQVNSRKIYSQFKRSIPKFEEGLKTKLDGYEYYSTASLEKDHRKYYRIHKKRKKLILNVNNLAHGKKYFEISGIFPSRNHKYIAYGEDLNGRRQFSIVVKDINKGKNIEKNQCFSSGNVIWNADSAGYFYLKKDSDTLITNSLYFHKLGTKTNEDKLIYKENDKQFSLNISLSRTKKYLLMNVSKTESNETWFLDLEKKDFNLKCFAKRKNKHLYYVDDTPESFFILSRI